jgi:hypothetical protein
VSLSRIPRWLVALPLLLALINALSLGSVGAASSKPVTRSATIYPEIADGQPIGVAYDTVSTGTISGTVQTPGSTPAGGWVVLMTLDKKPAKNASGQEIGGVSANATTGAFSFTSVPMGSYLAQVTVGSSSGFASSFPTPVQLVGGIQSPSALVLKLNTIQFAGVVRQWDGTALTQQAGLRFTSSDKSVVHYTGTNNAGEFKVGALPLTASGGAALTYTVEATPPYQTAGVAAVPIANLTPAASPAMTLDISLGKPILKGKLLMPTGSTVVRDAELVLVAANGTRTYGSTRQDGTFAFGSLTTGAYTLKINPPRTLGGVTSPEAQAVSITTGQTTDVGDLRLRAAKKTITVTIANEEGTKITSAKVQGVERGGQGMVMTDSSNASGQFTLSVGSGTWMISAQQSSLPGDWLYGGQPKSVEFSSDPELVETATVALTVRKTVREVIGNLCKAPCNTFPVPPAQYFPNGSVVVRVEDASGFGSTVRADSTGYFSTRLPMGTYRIRFFASDTSWAPPSWTKTHEIKITGTGSRVELSRIIFTQKAATLGGSVRDANGNGIAGVPIQAWRKDGADHAAAVSGTDGSFTVSAEAGTWMMQPAPSFDSGYAYVDGPALLEVAASGTTTAAPFTLRAADATITGTAVDSTTGVAISSLRGVAIANGRAGTKGFAQGQVVDGRFTIRVPRGQYNVTLSLPPGSGFGAATSVPADPTTADSTVPITIPVVETNARITGRFLDGTNPLTGVAASVFGVGGSGRNEWAPLNRETGAYNLRVPAGQWYVRGYVDPGTSDYAVASGASTLVTASATAPVTLDFAVVRASATLAGKVTDSTGAALPGVRVFAIDAARAGKDATASGSVDADASGNYSLKVPTGTYRLGAAGGTGFLPPAPVVVGATADATTTTNLQFRALDSTITGQVSLDGVAQPYAFVRAYPAGGGGSRSTTADASGNYSLSVAGGLNWNVQAAAEKSNPDGSIQAYRSATQSVAAAASATTTLNLALASAASLPAAIALTFDVTQSTTLELSDGTRVLVPAGAMGDTGTATLRVSPKSQVEQSLEHRLLDTAYEMAAFDSSNVPITKFNAPVSIVLKYDPTTLPTGTSVTDLLPQYWDTVTSSWKPAENVVVNTTDNTITLNVTHFTDYAITTSDRPNYRVVLPLEVRLAAPIN